jgi:hypothetical protein
LRVPVPGPPRLMPTLVKHCLSVSASNCLPDTAQRGEELKRFIVHFFEASDSTYGYRRVHADVAEHGVACGLELVRALMRELKGSSCW